MRGSADGKPPRPCGGGGGGTLLYERVRAGGGGSGFVAEAAKLEARIGGCIAGDDRDSATSPLGFCEGDTPSLPRVRRAPSVTLPRVLLHRLVDEVVDRAFQLLRHLLKSVPEDVAALEGARRFLVGIRAHEVSVRGILALTKRRWKEGAGQVSTALSWRV